MPGWCPLCGRELGSLTVSEKGSCPFHGYVWAEVRSPSIVVNTESDLPFDVIGLYLRTEEDVVIYRDPQGDQRHAPVDCVEVVQWNDRRGEW